MPLCHHVNYALPNFFDRLKSVIFILAFIRHKQIEDIDENEKKIKSTIEKLLPFKTNSRNLLNNEQTLQQKKKTFVGNVDYYLIDFLFSFFFY